MKVSSREFERRLRRAIRVAIAASPELKREAKRVKRRKNYKAGGWVLLTPIFFAFVCTAGITFGFRVQLLVLTLLSVLTVSIVAAQFNTVVYQSAELKSFFHLPISDHEVFRRQFRVFLRNTLGPGICFLLLLFATAFTGKFSLWQWAFVPVIAIAHWGTVLVSAILLGAYVPRYPHGLIILLGTASGFACLFGFAANGHVASILRHVADWPFWIIPVGWTSCATDQMAAGHNILAFGILVAPLLYWTTLKAAVERLASSYVLQESVELTPEILASEDVEDTDLSEAADLDEIDVVEVQSSYRAGPTEIEDDIRNRSFLQTFEIKTFPWMERFALTRMTDRERLIIDSLGAMPAWTKDFTKATKFLVVFAFALLAIRVLEFHLNGFIYFIVAFIAAFRFLPLTNPLSAAFAAQGIGGIVLRWYSGFPLSFQEISRLILKLNWMRLMFFAPHLLVFAVLTAFAFEAPSVQGLLIGLKSLWLLFAIQPFMIVFYFSAGTNDTSLSGKQLPVIVSFIAVAFAFLGFGAGTVWAESNFASIVCGIAALAVSVAFHFAYRWLFNRTGLDLMQLPPENGR